MTIPKRPSPDAYLRAKNFLDVLKASSNKLSDQQYRTLRGQALGGDIAGAYKGLDRLMSEFDGRRRNYGKYEADQVGRMGDKLGRV